MVRDMNDTLLQDLHDQLDSLWISYLTHLDAYQEAQKAIQKELSDGVFSLAQANRRISSGRRIGRDWYDQRSKATTRVTIDPTTSESGKGDLEVQFGITHVPQLPKADDKARESRSTSSIVPDARKDVGALDQDELSSSDEVAKPQKDPITWYGLMPSSSLRAAQSSFLTMLRDQETVQGATAGTDDGHASPTAKASNAARALRSTEAEIRRKRKLIRAAERSTQLAAEPPRAQGR